MRVVTSDQPTSTAIESSSRQSSSGAVKARRRMAPLAAILLTSLLLPVLAACEKSPAATTAALPPPPKVSVADVLIRPVTEWDEVTGRLEAPESVIIRPVSPAISIMSPSRKAPW